MGVILDEFQKALCFMSSCCSCPAPVMILACPHVNELRPPLGVHLVRNVSGQILCSISNAIQVKPLEITLQRGQSLTVRAAIV